MELNEVKKRFKRCILEYTNAAGSFDLSEDGEDDASAMGGAAPADGGGNAPMGGAPMNGNGDMDGGMPTDGGDPNAMGGTAPAQAPNGFAPQGVDPNAGMDGMGGGAAADGSMPMDGGDPNAMGATTEEPGDEVIDVDELVKAQDEAQHKIDSMSSKFDKLMGAIDVLIQQNKDREAQEAAAREKFESEMEKRNPTPLQRMTMRSTKSRPYTMTPSEYANNYMPDNYSPEDDNNGADDPQYQITKSDIDNISDYNAIAKELDVEHQGLQDLLDF